MDLPTLALPSLSNRVAALHAASGDISFIRAKIALAAAAGRLATALSLRSDPIELKTSRTDFAREISRFIGGYGQKIALDIDPLHNDQLDTLAETMADYGMEHRPR